MGEKGARLTQASESFEDHVFARLESLGGITSRKMLGGFGILLMVGAPVASFAPSWP